MASSTEHEGPEIPFPILCISSKVRRYMLFDIDVITWLRREHRILGVLIGSLPQIPQQNVFLGLPLELMPEETRLLVETGIAYIVYDREWHDEVMQSSDKDQFQAFQQEMTKRGIEAAKSSERRKLESTERALKKLELERHSGLDVAQDAGVKTGVSAPTDNSESPFASSGLDPAENGSASSSADTKAWAITPVVAHPLFPKPPVPRETELPAVKASSYAIFKHLHEQGYYLAPGLRFGCQYTAYPGDPLRFHSHFLTVGVDWDEKVDLMDIVGGGRLGTGVKKAFLIGGAQESAHGDDGERVRTFCIEWAGM